MIKLLLIVLLVSNCAYGRNLYHSNEAKIDVNGYVGYKYISSTAEFSAVSSEPELGLDLSVEYGDNWSVFTQFQYDEHIDHALVYSFASYKTLLTENTTVRVNVGKLRHDYGLFNTTRINPRTRQGVIVPQSIYWDSLKELFTSGTGINFGITFKNLEIQYTIDNPLISDPVETAKIWSSSLLDETDTSFGSHQLVSAKYDFDTIPLVLKSTWSYINLGNQNSKILKQILPQYATSDQIAELWTNGFIYTKDKWTFSSEVLIVKPWFGDWFNSDLHSMGMSFTAEYELSNYISIRANYNKYKSPPSRVPQEWYRRYEDINVGINYHRKNWMIGAEVHHINGGRTVHPDDWKNDPDSYKEWLMVGVNFVYFF